MKQHKLRLQLILVLSALFMVACGEHTENVASVKQAHAELLLPEQPDSAQIASIGQVSRIWGFVKYHHPAFSSDEFSADAEYFKLMNRVLQAPDSMRNGIFLDWIDTLGPFELRKDVKDASLEVFNDFRWIADTQIFGQPLVRKLLEVRQADSRKNNYVKQTPVNVSYLEPVYEDLPSEDVAYRLLGVAKFWNAIDSYSPNRNLTDRPWEEVLDDYIALAFDRSVGFSELYSRLVVELCDTHVNTWVIPIFGGRFVPLMCRFAEERLFVNDTCSLVANDFQIGDEILRIDSVRPIDRLSEMAAYSSHSNRASLLRDGSYATLLTEQDEVQVEYCRDGEIHTVIVPSVDSEKFIYRVYNHLYASGESTFKEVADGVGCIQISSLTCDDEDEMEKFLSKYGKVIIDLRGYPAEYAVIHRLLPKYFFAESRTALQTLLPQADRPGTYVREDSKTLATSDPAKLFKGQVVLLLDACTQSMAEYFTMFLQTIPGVVTMGSQTAGADGNVTRITLPYAWFNLTGLGVLYPDGTNAQRKGVKIDVVVEPSAESLLHGEDEQLHAAIDYLQKSNA